MKIIILAFILNLSLYGITYTAAQKQKYLYPLGKKIYLLKCKNLKNKKFPSYEELYNYIDKHCNLKENRYKTALGLYIWDNYKDTHSHIKFTYNKKDKCPICGMFIYKFPDWTAMMIIGKKRYYFDGVKDMMKFYYKQTAKNIQVYAQDYYTKEIINAKKAYFVTGSDIYGPMGEEFIPFKTKKEAKNFLFDHKGKKILLFSQITKEVVKKIDEY